MLLLVGAGLSWLQRDADAPQEEVPHASGGETAAELTLPLNWQLTASSERALFQRLDQADRLWRPRLVSHQTPVQAATTEIAPDLGAQGLGPCNSTWIAP